MVVLLLRRLQISTERDTGRSKAKASRGRRNLCKSETNVNVNPNGTPSPTCTIRPITKTMATQETMSAWFCMTNSWLRIGGFLLELLRPFTVTILADRACVHCAAYATRQTGRTETEDGRTRRQAGPTARTGPRRFTGTETSCARTHATNTRRPTPSNVAIAPVTRWHRARHADHPFLIPSRLRVSFPSVAIERRDLRVFLFCFSEPVAEQDEKGCGGNDSEKDFDQKTLA